MKLLLRQLVKASQGQINLNPAEHCPFLGESFFCWFTLKKRLTFSQLVLSFGEYNPTPGDHSKAGGSDNCSFMILHKHILIGPAVTIPEGLPRQFHT